MYKEILVLACSDKHKHPEYGGYCVGGVDLNDSKKWIRLIGLNDKFNITNRELYYDEKSRCVPLDVIGVNVSRPEADGEGWSKSEHEFKRNYPSDLYIIQPENHIVRGKLKFIRKATIEEALNAAELYCGKNIYLNNEKRLSIEEAKINQSSLLLVKVDGLKLYSEDDMNGGYKRHYKTSFHYQGKLYKGITCTDPDYMANIEKYNEITFGDSYLVISLGEAFKGYHYKLIAKVFPLSYTIENNKLNVYHTRIDCDYLKKYKYKVKRELIEVACQRGLKECKKCRERVEKASNENGYILFD